MLFNTIDFVIFLPIAIFLYYLIPQKYRWIMLLTASYYFYMSWKVEYIFLIAFSTLIDYSTGILMEKSSTKRKRRLLLILSLTTNLGLLFFFKYFNFAANNLNEFLDQFSVKQNVPLMNFLLPVGISFYTFQTLSYSIDVYYGRQKAEKHLGYFALYVSFFPQLVAGPIERFSKLTPQFKVKHVFTYDNLANGLRLILYGLFIKMVIADNLAILVDEVYSAPENFSSFDIFKGLMLYSFQIYSDFYGYSIIAIGSAQLMGIKLMDNFRTPYLAKNISEFWQRWHISLSTWFRDYLYFPLGGNRVSKQRWIFNILIVFVVSGLWHGASWTFLIWGALFGIVYMIEHFFNKSMKITKEFKPYSFGHFALALKTFIIVTLIWVFFRSDSFESAMNIFKLLFENIGMSGAELVIPNFLIVFFSLFIISDLLLYNKRFDNWLGNFPAIGRWTVYGVLIFAIIVFAGVEDFPFIYFQF
ncbi:MBOAT family protein [Brumimicrobium glaciale]|uniref:MBOAT family protein n=1 Tax=Brumimicrobium glaciale TaxID=200475 RepID=A0A4Q4KL77_9FLAO|nr:MBOAT family O-acyltransferase [Brumimicrobium glaciale]RYM34143.1 MBOAT family protein [Brumimicrobium glaciale]